MKRVVAAAFVAAMWLPLPGAAAEVLGGMAQIVDGKTLRVKGQVLTLYGIDAPDIRQTCFRPQGQWPCGVQSASALRDLVSGEPVNCAVMDKPVGRPPAAVCYGGGVSLNERMVESGMAIDWPHFRSSAYLPQQNAAKAYRRGLWSGSFDLPIEWRRVNNRAPQ